MHSLRSFRHRETLSELAFLRRELLGVPEASLAVPAASSVFSAAASTAACFVEAVARFVEPAALAVQSAALSFRGDGFFSLDSWLPTRATWLASKVRVACVRERGRRWPSL